MMCILKAFAIIFGVIGIIIFVPVCILVYAFWDHILGWFIDNWDYLRTGVKRY